MRIHIRLDFENKTGKLRTGRADNFALNAFVPTGFGSIFQKGIEKQIHAEISHRAAEKHGSQTPFADGI